MSRPWQYTRKRYRVMQGVMCLILAATVGLAALVSRQKASPVKITQAVAVGPVKLKVPAGWRVVVPKTSPTQASDRPPAHAITVREMPADGEVISGSRILHILEEDGQESRTPYEYFLNRKPSGDQTRPLPVVFGKFKWVWVKTRTADPPGEVKGGGETGFTHWLCTAARPGTFVLIWLEGFDSDDREDEQLVKDVAATLEVKE